jgi:hypothetical protein
MSHGSEFSDAELFHDDNVRRQRDAEACDKHLVDLVRAYGQPQPTPRVPKFVVGAARFVNSKTGSPAP